MIKPMRTFLSALLIMSAFCVVSCNRDWNDCCCNPCEMKCSNPCEPCAPCEPACEPCSPKCDPCGPACEPCCKEPRNCTPCCKTPRCFRDDGPGRCSPCREDCAKPCPPEGNPYYPCDPSFFPCGSNNCEKPFPEEVCYGRMAVYKTCDDCVVDLCQRAPEYATVGAPYPIEITITARKECAEVMVNQTLPCDSVFIKSEPAATPDKDNKLAWHFPHLTCGETQKICVWVKPEREGCCLAAATVCACPQLCAYTKCGQPVICIKKYGPACACLYCPVPYRIEVCNNGSAVAYDVVVQDAVPEGLTHSTGYRCLNYELGTLCPGDSKTINLEFCASQRGSVTNVATVSFCGGAKCTAEATTLINEPCVEVSMSGADWAYICKEVDFNITVTNPGDLVLRDVVIDNVSPAGTTICGAPGAEICCNRAVWCLSELCPGETKTFTVTVCSQVAGNLTNQVSVSSQSDCGTCTMCAEATCQWRGIAATHMCMVDTVDPICVGDTTVYRICVTNRGTADDANVSLSVNFSEQLSPQSANGPTKGTVSGNTVTFAPVERLAPKQSMEYCITVKGISVGDARAEATLSSDLLSTPVTDQESTHVY